MLFFKDELASVELAPGIGIGFSVSQGWFPLVERPFLILVGLTGVGKSTVTAALSHAGLEFSLLPNRRTLTDRFIIPTIVKMDEKGGNPSCRLSRLYYTRRYKQLFPAGMVHILSQLQIAPLEIHFPLIFDGLRGENEVTYATKMLPLAQFVFLDAPEYVRLQRLLIRNDSFDRVAKSSQAGQHPEVSQSRSFADLGVPEASVFFSDRETAEILERVRQGVYSVSAVRDRLKIVVEERRSYDPSATRAALEKLASDRTLVIDTTRYSPELIARKVVQFLHPEA